MKGIVQHRPRPTAMILVLILVLVTESSIIPERHKSRVHRPELSNIHHYLDRDGDNLEEDHDMEYDHESFVGEDRAREFEKLKDEESKEKLGEIYDKIDTNQDSRVSEEELTAWIQLVHDEKVQRTSLEEWNNSFEDGASGSTLTWKAYSLLAHGTEEALRKLDQTQNGGEAYRKMMKRDERRWSVADQDKSGALTLVEFSNFLHPEQVDHMKDTMIQEAIEEMDKDKDGLINLEEYIADMWTSKDGEKPEWVDTEAEDFKSFHDKNGDGFMNRQEVTDWIYPPDDNHTNAEARHLIKESDANKDGFLTKQEMVDQHELFVGSKAMDEEYVRHDEF